MISRREVRPKYLSFIFVPDFDSTSVGTGLEACDKGDLSRQLSNLMADMSSTPLSRPNPEYVALRKRRKYLCDILDECNLIDGPEALPGARETCPPEVLTRNQGRNRWPTLWPKTWWPRKGWREAREARRRARCRTVSL